MSGEVLLNDANLNVVVKKEKVYTWIAYTFLLIII